MDDEDDRPKKRRRREDEVGLHLTQSMNLKPSHKRRCILANVTYFIGGSRPKSPPLSRKQPLKRHIKAWLSHPRVANTQFDGRSCMASPLCSSRRVLPIEEPPSKHLKDFQKRYIPAQTFG
jgi:hypothetical protein